MIQDANQNKLHSLVAPLPRRRQIFSSALEAKTLLHSPAVRQSIKIDLFVQDGLHASGMLRKELAWIPTQYSLSEQSDEEAMELSSHLHWAFGGRCILHVAQSAAVHGMWPALPNDIVSHDCHVVVASLLNSSGAVLKRCDEFLFT